MQFHMALHLWFTLMLGVQLFFPPGKNLRHQDFSYLRHQDYLQLKIGSFWLNRWSSMAGTITMNPMFSQWQSRGFIARCAGGFHTDGITKRRVSSMNTGRGHYETLSQMNTATGNDDGCYRDDCNLPIVAQDPVV